VTKDLDDEHTVMLLEAISTLAVAGEHDGGSSSGGGDGSRGEMARWVSGWRCGDGYHT
jgi:hypothetical protein